MLPKRNPHQFDNQVHGIFSASKHKFNVMANSVFLRRDARLKKRDSNKNKETHVFSFETVRELYHLQSWRDFVIHPAAPMCALYSFLCIFVTAIGLYETLSWRIDLYRNTYADPMDLYRVEHYDRALLLEVEEALTTAMHLEHKGVIKNYIAFLEEIIPKYCMDYLKQNNFQLSVVGNENFHLNLKTSIRFVANGVTYDDTFIAIDLYLFHVLPLFLLFFGVHVMIPTITTKQGIFDEHKMLAIDSNGGIIDPTIPELNPYNQAEPCPLLTGLWEMGIPRQENRAKDHVFRIDAPRDNKHAFDHYVRSYHVDSLVITEMYLEH